MDEHDISGLPVVDEDGALVGVLSADRPRPRASDRVPVGELAGLAVRHLMTQPAVTVHRSTPLRCRGGRMERDHVHRLVVVEDDDRPSPIGVISMTDLVRALARDARDDRRT